MISRHEAQELLKTCKDWKQKTYLETIVELWGMFGDANADLQQALDMMQTDREALRGAAK